jgi:hypothetical protein
VEDRSVQIELNYGLRLVERREFALEVSVFEFHFRDVCSELHNPFWFSVNVKDRIVGSVDPDFFSILAKSLLLALAVFACTQETPEIAVFIRFDVFGIAERSVMFALDLL